MVRPDDFLLVILAGPSGTGKSTLANKLLGEFPDFTPSVSFTTRAPRAGEVDGTHYHFIDRARFLAMIERHAFLEWADVFGNLYGTSAETVDSARLTRRGVLFDIDYQGARQIRAARPAEVVGIFIVPPSFVELEKRLRGRGTDADEVIQHRLRKASHEIESYGLFDYLIVNDSLERAYEEVRAIVMAERAKRTRRAALVEALLRGELPKVER